MLKAIVLTYDKYRPLFLHMVSKYEELWADFPVRYYVPYQDPLFSEQENSFEFVSSEAPIKQTMEALLRGLDDDEMVYWCIDDKYPIWLDINKVSAVVNWAVSQRIGTCDGVLFCRCRAMHGSRHLFSETVQGPLGVTMHRRRGLQQIWIHQLIRVRVLRFLFDQFQGEINAAKHMDKYINQISLPDQFKLLVTASNYAVFGESTTRGKVTANCFRSMSERGYKLGDLEVDFGANIVMGEKGD